MARSKSKQKRKRHQFELRRKRRADRVVNQMKWQPGAITGRVQLPQCGDAFVEHTVAALLIDILR